VLFTCGIDHDVMWQEGSERALSPYDAQAINSVYPGLLHPVRQSTPEPALPAPGTPAEARMRARTHALAHPQRLYRGEHQAIKG